MRSSSPDLLLTYDDNGTEHGDIAFRCGGARVEGDSYYFAVDGRVCPGDASPRKVRRVLSGLFERWSTALKSCRGGDLLLPCLLFDEYSLWLKVTVSGEQVQFEPGWSTTPGHNVDICAGASSDVCAEFDPLGEDSLIQCDRAALLAVFNELGRRLEILEPPELDPTPIFELFRGQYSTQLLTIAVAHLEVFEKLARGPKSEEQLRDELGLASRPYAVLMTALRAMEVVETRGEGEIALTPLGASFLGRSSPYCVADYIGLAAGDPSVLGMLERLKSNRPAGLEEGEAGTAFIYRAGVPSAMDEVELAGHFTQSLAGRARNVAPRLAEVAPLRGRRKLVDVGGGSGLYGIAYAARHPDLEVVVYDRPEVLPIAIENAQRYGVAGQIETIEGDMFADPIPSADAILLSNVLHDWDVPECHEIVRRCVAALEPGGVLLIHDVFLNDAWDGPLPIALYSAALFTLTEGRAYAVREYREWLEQAGLTVAGPVETAIHCGVLTGARP